MSSASPDPSASIPYSKTVGAGAALYLVYLLFKRLATFGLSVVVAHRLGTVGTGAFGVAIQVSNLASLVAALNLPQALARYLAKEAEPNNRGMLLVTSATLVLPVALIVGAILALGSAWFAQEAYRDPTLGTVLAWTGPLTLATAAILWVEGALQGERRFAFLAVWGSVLAVAELVGGAVGTAWGVIGVLAARCAARLAAGAAGAVATGLGGRNAGLNRIGGPRFGETTTTLLRFGGLAFASAVVVLSGQTVLRLILVRVAGLGSAGEFQAADSIGQGLLLIPGAAAVAFLPSIARAPKRDEKLGASISRALTRVTGFNTPLCVLVAGASPWLIRWIYGSEFLSADRVLVLLSVAYGWSGMGLVLGAVLIGRGELGAGLLLNLAWLVTLLVSGAFWIEAGQATGAAGALVIAYGVLLLVLAMFGPRRWGIAPISVIRPFVVNVAVLGGACAVCLAPSVAPVAKLGVVAVLSLVLFLAWGFPELAILVRSRKRR